METLVYIMVIIGAAATAHGIMRLIVALDGGSRQRRS